MRDCRDPLVFVKSSEAVEAFQQAVRKGKFSSLEMQSEARRVFRQYAEAMNVVDRYSGRYG